MDETLFPVVESGASKREDEVRGAVRLLRPHREQLQLRAVDLEALVAANHPVRAIWDFVESLDLEALYARVRAVEGAPGRPAIDPRIYLALWLYATVEGVGSARALERLCEQHDAYRWICGGVSVNYHSLADFRVHHEGFLDGLLTQSVGVLMAQGLVTLQRVAQDGMRIRTSAGSGSFRTKPRLQKCLRQAQQQVERLRRELEEDPQASHRREVAAQQRAAEERQRRVSEAVQEMQELEARREQQKKRKKDRERPLRVSITDPEARVMKMADGGFRPAYNGHFCVDVATQIVVGVDLSNHGNDRGQLVPMIEQLQRRYGLRPAEILADSDFAGLQDVTGASELGATVFAPLPPVKNRNRDPHVPLRGDNPAIAQWRQRMGTDAAKQIYQQRASSVECVNALARQRGLYAFRVRGRRKARTVLLWYALAHNVMRTLSLLWRPVAAIA